MIFEDWLESLEVVPTIKAMQCQAEEIRQKEANKVISKLSKKLSEDEI